MDFIGTLGIFSGVYLTAMSDTFASVSVLLIFAYLVSNYKRQSVEAPRQSVEAPNGALPLQDMPDVRRYKHDGTQPVEQKSGNDFHAAPFPEVESLLS